MPTHDALSSCGPTCAAYFANLFIAFPAMFSTGFVGRLVACHRRPEPRWPLRTIRSIRTSADLQEIRRAAGVCVWMAGQQGRTDQTASGQTMAIAGGSCTHAVLPLLSPQMGHAYRCFCTPEELAANRRLGAVRTPGASDQGEEARGIYTRKCLRRSGVWMVVAGGQGPGRRSGSVPLWYLAEALELHAAPCALRTSHGR
jgi:hypothetical protein